MREWPLIGRAEELRFIDSSLRRPGRAHGVVLAGAAGVGKTRLAREAARLDQSRGAVVRWVSANESARSVPLGVFAGLVADVADPRMVVREMVENVASGDRSVVVVVDDANLLDDVSALVVNQLVLQRRATVVITVRTGEPAPAAVAALWKDEHLERLEIQPLSERETGLLLEAAHAGQVDRRTVRRLWDLTRGNVLFLRQLVLAGGFSCHQGVWQLSDAVDVPTVLVDMVAARLDLLSEQVREVVDVLAVSEPLDIRLLSELTSAGGLEAAENVGLIAVESENEELRARLAHPMYGEVRRNGMGRLRARRLRGRVANGLASSISRSVEDPVRRAVLMLDSDLAPDVELFVHVGENALGLADFGLAKRLGKAAVDSGGGFRAQAIVAYAAMWSVQPDVADEELAILAQLAATDNDLVRATLNRATNLAFILELPEQAVDLLDDAANRILDAKMRYTLRALQAQIESAIGRLDKSAETAAEVLANDPTEAGALFASIARVVWAATAGHSNELRCAVARGKAAIDGAPEFANFRVPLLMQYVHGLLWAGHVDLALSEATEYRSSVEDSPLAGGSYLVGVVLLGRGDLVEARRELLQTRAGLARQGNPGGQLYGALIAWTHCAAACGDLDSARQGKAEMLACGHRAAVFVEPLEAVASAWVAAVEGNVSTAIRLAHTAAESARRLGQHAHTAIALHTAVRFGDHTVAAELADLASHVEGPRAPAAAAHASALAADDGAGLNAASLRFEEIGDRLSAADAAAQAAQSFLRHGLKGSAAAANARARRIAEQCGNAHSPALLSAEHPELPISAREREILTLAARGLTNREIADRLTVSKRTVEGHLYRACGKLGTTDRREFAAILGLDRSASDGTAAGQRSG